MQPNPKMNRKIRVLVLDDSLMFREVLAKGLALDPMIQVVAKAEDPFDAVDKIETFKPDVITCDVTMPKMDGIEFIRQLMPQHPVPVIVISSATKAVFDAMDAGAVDFINKPNMQSPHDFEVFIKDLHQKVREVSRAKVVVQSQENNLSDTNVAAHPHTKLIAIGASTGGTEAIFHVLSRLPKSIPGIVIVQHIPPMFSKMFAERLNNQTHFTVVEGKSNEIITPGKVIVAPGDQHMRVRKVGDQYKVETFSGERVNGHCPSVDVLMQSVAEVAADRAVGVILTGMGYDGAKGLMAMRRAGAKTLSQDEASSVVYGMPKVAFEIGASLRQVPLNQMAHAIVASIK